MKTLFIFLLLMLSLSSSAQTEHVRFLGITLDGTIQQFQDELLAIGCTYDKETSALLPKGAKAFRGSYSSHDALLIVFHDETTNIVYQAKAVITCHGADSCETVFNSINGMLQAEYGSLLSTKSTQYGHDSYGYSIMSEQRVVIGDAGLFVTRNENKPDEYLVQVQYTDIANMRIHEKQKAEDN